MKPIAFLLLFSVCTCQVVAQDKAGDDISPAGNETPDEAAVASENASCPDCTPAERLIVDLNYYKQVLNILEQIDQQRNKINPVFLQSVHAALIGSRPELAALLKAEAEARKPPPPPLPVVKVKKPAKKPVVSVKKPALRQGIEGLIVGHVNEANDELGIKASVVLVSNKRPRSLNVDGVIEHNGRSYKVLEVRLVEDLKKGSRHEVYLQEQTSKKIHQVPWK